MTLLPNASPGTDCSSARILLSRLGARISSARREREAWTEAALTTTLRKNLGSPMKLQTSLKLLGVFGLTQLAIFGCTASQDETTDAPAAASGTPTSEGSQYPASAAGIRVVDVGADGVATFITGNLGTVPSAYTPSSVVANLAGLTRAFHTDASDLVFTRSHGDSIGDTHYRFRQTREGRDVIGAELVLHARNGVVYAANGAVRSDLRVSATVAAIGDSVAISSARKDLSGVANVVVGSSPDLAYLPTEDEAVLVYRVDVTGSKHDATPVHDTVLVDAVKGTVVARIPHIHTAENREVHDAKNRSTLPGALVVSEGGTGGDATAKGNYDNLGTTYDCYKQLFNRDSFDNSGAKLISTVHYQSNYNNAFWNGTQMVYGDGDGTLLANLATAIDVTAHELTHAVTERTSGLIYSGESGGLNESMSDIFGNTCEWFKAGKPEVPPDATWLVGEEVLTPATAGDALRYMNDPAKDGKSLDLLANFTSSVDVHYSSGISNLAFYLLAHGGNHPRGKTNVVVTGIGIDKASQIFYRANTTIFTASTKFVAARTATEQAATQLGYSPDTIASVSAAWAAVGVGPTTTPPGDGGTGGGGTDAGQPPPPPPPPADGGASSCAHGQCSRGTKLESACDPCVAKICAADSYCCSSSWDSLCVREVKSICKQTCN